MPLNDALARELVAARVRRRMSQAEVGALLGWPQTKVSRIERGAANITVANVEALCAVLGTTPAKIIKAAS